MYSGNSETLWWISTSPGCTCRFWLHILLSHWFPFRKVDSSRGLSWNNLSSVHGAQWEIDLRGKLRHWSCVGLTKQPNISAQYCFETKHGHVLFRNIRLIHKSNIYLNQKTCFFRDVCFTSYLNFNINLQLLSVQTFCSDKPKKAL